MDDRTPELPPIDEQHGKAHGLELVMGLTFLVVGLMALLAAWMYWIAPALLAVGR